MIMHHRRFACGRITCGEQDPEAHDTPIVAIVTCEPCIADLRARNLLPPAGNSAGNSFEDPHEGRTPWPHPSEDSDSETDT
jgi:hypothetical protein